MGEKLIFCFGGVEGIGVVWYEEEIDFVYNIIGAGFRLSCESTII